MAKKKAPLSVKKSSRKKLPAYVLEFFKKEGSRGGKLGGAKAWQKLTREQRSARAKKAAAKSAVVRSKKAAVKKKAKEETA
jgi:hypothetical protein